MAGRGPAPKASERRQRRNVEPDLTEISVGARVKAPPALPKAPPTLRTWSAFTRTWYETWRRSPQATRFTSTDWQRLHMLALLVERYYRDPVRELLSEIRLNEAKLGATPEDRQRLHWKIVDHTATVEAPAAKASSRRRRDPRLKLIEGGA